MLKRMQRYIGWKQEPGLFEPTVVKSSKEHLSFSPARNLGDATIRLVGTRFAYPRQPSTARRISFPSHARF